MKLSIFEIFPLIILCIQLFFIASWGINLYKFTQCDFKGPEFKEEILYGIGILSPICVVTAWMDLYPESVE